MKKISIGIFTVAIAILFILSTSISVTAATHDEKIMDLTSIVNGNSPYADVDMAPVNVWSYSNWNWTVDVANGDNIIIKTDYYYENNQAGSGTGRHDFLVSAVYENDPDPRRYDDADYGITTNNGQSGSGTLTIDFNNIDEGAVIIIYWSVIARNIPEDVEDIDEHYGYITLT